MCVGADSQRARQQVSLIIKDLRGQVMSDRDQGNVGSNRQCRPESGGPLSRQVLEKRRREVFFFLIRRVALSAVGRGRFGPTLN